ncbi:MAG: YidB family protein [Acidimicrobiales bacterium]
MGLMDIVGGLLGKKKKGGTIDLGGAGGGITLPGGIELPGNLAQLAGGNAGLLKALLPVLLGSGALGGKLGGLGGLLGKLQAGGLEGKAQSWVGTGANEPVDPDELEQALGADTVAEIASEAGVSHQEAKGGLASLLPKLIDGVTPGGSVPGGDQLAGMLKGLDLSKILR